MKKIKIMGYTVSLLLVVLVSKMAFGAPVWADNQGVSVVIPSYNVTFNARSIESSKMQYPLIVYNNITYFPLTSRMCSELGLVSGYSQESGLHIVNYTAYDQEAYDALDEGGHQRAGTKYPATIANYPVYINGKKIDNVHEEYPLLNFRNITYVPLTWRFVVDEFGWNLSWDDVSGFKLSTVGDMADLAPGSKYKTSNDYILEGYRDYGLIERSIEERMIDAVPDEYGNYTNKFVGRSYAYFKLDFATDTFVPVPSKITSDEPYNNGRISGEEVSEQFEGVAYTLSYNGNPLMDLKDEAGEANVIDTINATRYTVNGMTVYALSVYFTQNGVSVPPPYTPCQYYVFVDNGNGVMEYVKDWPSNQVPSQVFPYKTEGIYLCSNNRIFQSARYGNARGFVSIIRSDMTVSVLNERFTDWNSLEALGMDDLGNLYLKNTWFPDADVPNTAGKISPINDGFFTMDTADELTKIYPFVTSNKVIVTPEGAVYIDAGWKEGILHLQTGTWLSLE